MCLHRTTVHVKYLINFEIISLKIDTKNSGTSTKLALSSALVIRSLYKKVYSVPVS